MKIMTSFLFNVTWPEKKNNRLWVQQNSNRLSFMLMRKFCKKKKKTKKNPTHIHTYKAILKMLWLNTANYKLRVSMLFAKCSDLH